MFLHLLPSFDRSPSTTSRRGNILHLNLRHRSRRPAQVRLLRLRVLRVVIAYRALDRIFRQHRAVHCPQTLAKILLWSDLRIIIILRRDHNHQ